MTGIPQVCNECGKSLPEGVRGLCWDCQKEILLENWGVRPHIPKENLSEIGARIARQVVESDDGWVEGEDGYRG